jgi:hypothetical protein
LLIKKLKLPIYKNVDPDDKGFKGNYYYFYDLAMALTKNSLLGSDKYDDIEDFKRENKKIEIDKTLEK